jgi:hypothetical protein
MDLYRTHISDINTVEEADAYWRRYRGDFVIYPHAEIEFSLDKALAKLTNDGATKVCFIVKLRLNCDNMKLLFRNEEIMPTSLLVCKPNLFRVFDVAKEIHL